MSSMNITKFGITQAAEYLGVSVASISRWLKNGTLTPTSDPKRPVSKRQLDAMSATFENTVNITVASSMLGLSRETLYQYFRNGKLPFVMVNGRRRVLLSVIEDRRVPVDESHGDVVATLENSVGATKAAAILGVGRTTLYEHFDNGKVPFVMVNGRRRVLLSVIEELK